MKKSKFHSKKGSFIRSKRDLMKEAFLEWNSDCFMSLLSLLIPQAVQ